MKRRVIWSAASRADLIAIAGHIARDNPAAARKVASQIRFAGETLGEMATGRVGRVSGTYEKVVAGLPYLIAYEVLSEAQGEIVAILHVIHGARDWQPGAWPTP